MLFDKDRQFFAPEIIDSPLDMTERSLIVKRDRALERAKKRANLIWTDKKH